MIRGTVIFVTLFLAFAALAVDGHAGDKAKIDKSKIYYGNPSRFESPAVVDVQAVYLEIEEYKKIVDRNMDPSDPKYMMLMKAASRKFRKAVKDAAEAGGYDLIGALGSIVLEDDDVPEITSDVISYLP